MDISTIKFVIDGLAEADGYSYFSITTPEKTVTLATKKAIQGKLVAAYTAILGKIAEDQVDTAVVEQIDRDVYLSIKNGISYLEDRVEWFLVKDGGAIASLETRRDFGENYDAVRQYFLKLGKVTEEQLANTVVLQDLWIKTEEVEESEEDGYPDQDVPVDAEPAAEPVPEEAQ